MREGQRRASMKYYYKNREKILKKRKLKNANKRKNK